MNDISMEDAVNQLVAEGYGHDDVVAVADTLIEAGLELPQPDVGYILTAVEVDLIRDQINSGAGELLDIATTGTTATKTPITVTVNMRFDLRQANDGPRWAQHDAYEAACDAADYETLDRIDAEHNAYIADMEARYTVAARKVAAEMGYDVTVAFVWGDAEAARVRTRTVIPGGGTFPDDTVERYVYQAAWDQV